MNYSKINMAQTFNFYLQAVKQFCRWMVKDRRSVSVSPSPLLSSFRRVLSVAVCRVPGIG